MAYYHYSTGVFVPFVRKFYKQMIVVATAIFVASMASMTFSASAAVPNWTAKAGSTIDFSCLGNGSIYTHTLSTVTQDSNGTLTGTGSYNADPSYSWNLTGTISGDDVSLVITYNNNAFGSVYNLDGVVAPDGSASGNTDSNCQSFTMPPGSFTAAVSTPTVQACESFDTIHTTNLSTWNLSETRSAGHNVIVATGLHIYTDTDVFGSPDPRKAAGYYATNYPLSGLGNLTIDQSLNYIAAPGTIEPGLQLVVDFDNNGTPDGILVGESVYGNTWWLSNGSATFVKSNAPNTGGGYGSNWFGTANEWLTKFPTAQVKAIGYSLGSGVNGDGVIEQISLGCVNYTFGLPPVVKNKEECKDSGWMLGLADGRTFKNQGDCVSYFATKDKKNPNPPAGSTTTTLRVR